MSSSLFTEADRYLQYLMVMLQGLYFCVVITAFSFLMSLVFGSALAVLKRYGASGIQVVVGVYVEIFRAIPPLTIFFILYFGMNYAGVQLSSVTAAILGLGLIGSAYCCEIIRAGLLALHKGQREAALSVGLTPWGALRFVLMPQALRISLPSLGTFLIGLIKDTSIASAIAAPEILFRARNLSTETFDTTAIYLIAALIYIAITLPIARAVHRLEKSGASAT